jgi:hypothetical protein
LQGLDFLAQNLGDSEWYSVNRRYYYANTSACMYVHVYTRFSCILNEARNRQEIE